MLELVLSRVHRLVGLYRLRRQASMKSPPEVRGWLWIRGEGRIELGERVVFDAQVNPIELNVEQGAVIAIGDDVYVGGGTSIEAQKAVRIGARSRLGAFCKVIDNHFHSAVGLRTTKPPSVEVVIEEDVELGARAIVLPGGQVGRGSRIMAGTVITRRVPPGSSASGVPALVRPLERRGEAKT
jgi:acetyltransferase-like isoleucine patch superfamily enzyme